MGLFKNTQPEAQMAEMYISNGSKFEGNITSEGHIHVDGTVEGNITAGGNVISGEGSVIVGNVRGIDVIIGGTLTGDVFAKREFGAGEKAVVEGDVVCGAVSVALGAKFDGAVTVGALSAESTSASRERRRGRDMAEAADEAAEIEDEIIPIEEEGE